MTYPLTMLAVGLSLLLVLSAPGTALAQDPPLVVAFYYAWYDLNTWSSGQPAGQPVQAYASSDPATIERHVGQAQSAGIDALVQSWYGPQEQNNQTETNFRTLLEQAGAHGFHAAVAFETSGPFFPDKASVTDGLRYLLAAHAQHPAYLRYQGRPVIFFWRQGRFGVDEWAGIRQQVDPDHTSLWIAEGVDISYQAVFDGHYLYSIAWSADVGGTLADWASRVSRYEAQNGVNRLWVATTMPGYDDTRTSRSNAFAVSRRDGSYYRETWAAAAATQPDWIAITSFNEWIEGTMLEPSAAYGDLYLNLTRELAAAFKAGTGGRLEVMNSPPEAASLPPQPESQAAAAALQTEPYVRAEETVRVRSGPGTDFARVGLLTVGETAPVVGRNAASDWWQIEFAAGPDGVGWVTAEFVTVVGDASAAPVVAQEIATPTQTPAARATARVAPTPTPRATTRVAPSPTPRATTRVAPTDTPSAPPSQTPSPELTAAPTFGPTAQTAPSATYTPAPAASPPLSPAGMASTPMLRTMPAVQQQRPLFLWAGIAALALALGLVVVFVRALRRRR